LPTVVPVAFAGAVADIRIRTSLHTTDWKEAQHRRKAILTKAHSQKIIPAKQDFAKLSLPVAADRYLDGRKLELSASTWKKEKQLLVFPLQHFGKTIVQQIAVEDLLSYREWRSKNGAGAAMINMEIGIIRRILKRAKRWFLFEGEIRPLKENSQVGRALKPEEKAELLRMASTRPEWQVAKCAAIIALNTTMRGGELKELRWLDVNLINRLITVRKSKTDAGLRVIPINENALAAFLELQQRAQEFNGIEPEHYIFPTCEHGIPDPTSPMKSWRTSWRKLTTAITCPVCGLVQNPGVLCRKKSCKADISKLQSKLNGFRFHDMRHSAITELAESTEASEQTILSIAGHVSRKMLEHYSHIRNEAKRKALDALATVGTTAAPEPAPVKSKSKSSAQN
jgi:integrase